MSDEEAQRNAEADPDNPPATAAWLRSARIVTTGPKRPVSLRVDPDILDWFRRSGPRYQTRMNAVLRAYVDHQKQAAGED